MPASAYAVHWENELGGSGKDVLFFAVLHFSPNSDSLTSLAAALIILLYLHPSSNPHELWCRQEQEVPKTEACFHKMQVFKFPSVLH